MDDIRIIKSTLPSKSIYRVGERNVTTFFKERDLNHRKFLPLNFTYSECAIVHCFYEGTKPGLSKPLFQNNRIEGGVRYLLLLMVEIQIIKIFIHLNSLR